MTGKLLFHGYASKVNHEVETLCRVVLEESGYLSIEEGGLDAMGEQSWRRVKSFRSDHCLTKMVQQLIGKSD
ncbi:MAG: hypothetical protein WC683_02855 [bacterium]